MRTKILTAFIVLFVAASANAQTPAPNSYASWYFFGDSLTDNGNLFALTGSPPAPYYQGRVSNGPTWAEYLRPGLVAAATTSSNPAYLNFAFAGATATTAWTSPPNITMQIGMMQARGITPNAGSMVVLLAGANDILNTVAVPANQNGQAMTNIGVGASTAVVGAVQTLSSLGARNFLVVSLPDISRTPRFTTGSGAPAASLAQQASYAYNNDIRGRLANAPLPVGTRVTLFNLGALVNNLLLNSSRFGFSVTNQEYLGVLQSGANPGDVNNYIFWDGIHPTTKAHKIFADAMVEVMNPEFVLGKASIQPGVLLVTADMAADAIDDRLELVRFGGNRHSADGFISYSGKNGGRDAAGYAPGYEYDASHITAGFDYRMKEHFTLGLALTQETVDVTLASSGGEFTMKGETASAFAQWNSGSVFVEGAVGYGSHDVRNIRRTTAFGGMQTTGKTDGTRFHTSAKAGLIIDAGSARFTPFVGVRYVTGDLDGYVESGVPALNFKYEDQSAMETVGLIGASVNWKFSAGDFPLQLNLSGVYQVSLNDEYRETAGQLYDTVSTRATVATADGNDDCFKVGARLTGALGKRWGWGVGYRSEMRQDGKTANQYILTVHTGF